MSQQESSAGWHRPDTHILVIDKDKDLSDAIRTYLNDYNIPVDGLTDSTGAIDHIKQTGLDLLVLDLGPDDEKGLAFLQEIRTQSTVPIIVTGYGKNKLEQVICLEYGADAYIAKPYHMRELLAWTRTILRRQAIGRGQKHFLHTDVGYYRFNGWQLQHHGRRLTDPNGNSVTLGDSEYSLLVAFLRAPRRVLNRDYLRSASGETTHTSRRSIDVQVMRLRHRLKIDANSPQVITTLRGIGYVFTAMVTES